MDRAEDPLTSESSPGALGTCASLSAVLSLELRASQHSFGERTIRAGSLGLGSPHWSLTLVPRYVQVTNGHPNHLLTFLCNPSPHQGLAWSELDTPRPLCSGGVFCDLRCLQVTPV